MEGGGRSYHGHSATTINLVAIGASEYGAIMVLLRQFWGGNVIRASLPHSNVCLLMKMKNVLYVQVHTLSFQVHEAYVKYGNIDFLYVRILCASGLVSNPKLLTSRD